jgi:hypothetical protein
LGYSIPRDRAGLKIANLVEQCHALLRCGTNPEASHCDSSGDGGGASGTPNCTIRPVSSNRVRDDSHEASVNNGSHRTAYDAKDTINAKHRARDTTKDAEADSFPAFIKRLKILLLPAPVNGEIIRDETQLRDFPSVSVHFHRYWPSTWIYDST